MFKIAVLISGNGSNLEALISACKKNVINGTIDIIISNNPDAYGIERAKNHSINYKIIDYAYFFSCAYKLHDPCSFIIFILSSRSASSIICFCFNDSMSSRCFLSASSFSFAMHIFLIT